MKEKMKQLMTDWDWILQSALYSLHLRLSSEKEKKKEKKSDGLPFIFWSIYLSLYFHLRAPHQFQIVGQCFLHSRKTDRGTLIGSITTVSSFASLSLERRGTNKTSKYLFSLTTYYT